MQSEVLALRLGRIRGMDTNSLLRMYDVAKEISASAQFQQERAKAERAIQRLGNELRARAATVGNARTNPAWAGDG